MIETREELLAKRSELWERLEAIRQDYARGLDRNMDEQSLQLENEEVLAALSREAVEELQKIEQKLRLLEASRH